MQLFLSFIVALSITAALIPLLARWAPALKLTDAPGPRKVHAAPVPRVGGIAMTLGMLAPILISLELTPALRGFLAGLAVLFIFGVWDDRANLDYRLKFLGQIAAVALCVFVGDVHIDSLTFASRYELPQWLATILTFLFLIGVTNAVNLSDGLDGLAGGAALLCLCAIALLAAGNNPAITLLALTEAGAILGFLRFNTHPARVFMGDAGSQILGYSIGVLAILATQGERSNVSAALPLLLIGLPILDTLAVMLTRIKAGRSPFSSDRNHLHHRLLGLGFMHGEAVMLIYLLQGTLFLAAYFLRFESDGVILAAFAIFAAVVLATLRWAARRGWQAHDAGSVNAGVRLLGLIRRCVPAMRVDAWTCGIMAVGLLLYAATIIVSSGHVGWDVIVLCVALFALLALLTGTPAAHSSSLFERATAYVSVTLLVYLDQTSNGMRLALIHDVSWFLLAIMAAAALARFAFSPTRRFEVSPLDLLVLFLALVVPNLPGPVRLPEALSAGIAKAVILLYVVEMLLSLDFKRPVPRTCLVLTLGAIAMRGFLTA